jgi:hypothetical protein
VRLFNPFFALACLALAACTNDLQTNSLANPTQVSRPVVSVDSFAATELDPHFITQQFLLFPKRTPKRFLPIALYQNGTGPFGVGKYWMGTEYQSAATLEECGGFLREWAGTLPKKIETHGFCIKLDPKESTETTRVF